MALTSYQFRNQPYGLGFVFAGQAFTLIESTSYERVLQYQNNYILSIQNEGFYPTNVAVNLAFYESGN
ncbi:hypothetical protein [Bacillus suaedaesalsae]|uniref:Uncharacterized protein n=1 Tax=Bacillus suaedaesalsae TaxID=2810349 RepID=A0ABS2DDS9_9BACI|nr:hypothetical protein [Bacillus suaedaesalsae]MBM6616607.1 hypothetical protein [Bacillus suaedaesalsae]